MPELPEVEIARRCLDSWLTGRTIELAEIHDPRLSRGAPKHSTELAKRKVVSVSRRGKWLRIELSPGPLLFSHLGMTGKWVEREKRSGPEAHERARIDLVRGPSVRYLDPRRFGRLMVARADIEEWTSLGPDPLVDADWPRQLAERLPLRKRTVKEALMDQTVVAGVGNIYATEALWKAKIDPRSRTDRLSRADLRAIARGVERSMAETLKHEGASEITYVEERGAPNPFRIYGHEGEPCPRCKTKLTRIVLGGRTTTFCPKCQVRRS